MCKRLLDAEIQNITADSVRKLAEAAGILSGFDSVAAHKVVDAISKIVTPETKAEDASVGKVSGEAGTSGPVPGWTIDPISGEIKLHGDTVARAHVLFGNHVEFRNAAV